MIHQLKSYRIILNECMVWFINFSEIITAVEGR